MKEKMEIIFTMGRFELLDPRALVGRLIHYSMAAGLKNEQNPQYIRCARLYFYITENRGWPTATLYSRQRSPLDYGLTAIEY